MTVNVQQVLDSLASLLRVKLPNENTKDQVKYPRVTSAIFEMLKKAGHSSYVPRNNFETAEIQQWIEYGIVYLSHIGNPQNAHLMLKELNEILSAKTFLAAPRITIADAYLYYILSKTMESLTNLEKEKYLNVCRWFDTIQNDECLRRKTKLVNFSTIHLATLVPARH
ncbi:hypothetical protein JTB14_000958 [Gonioctena quinquepunctata]|nr:hypothetical protein JTB14_000958 [Gonioctena quinquepunctata]